MTRWLAVAVLVVGCGAGSAPSGSGVRGAQTLIVGPISCVPNVTEQRSFAELMLPSGYDATIGDTFTASVCYPMCGDAGVVCLPAYSIQADGRDVYVECPSDPCSPTGATVFVQVTM